ncbi:hypothetical protein GCM10023187_46480 [Nibrella viscosa]|uniref:DinB family protein n=1 Tax=Nibrella viscosa TaxID=1084524 RepID=A0ABP8KTZ4_9BACT
MKLQDVSAEIFGQLIGMTEKLTNEEYTRPLELLFHNSIGKHMRHIIEFYDLVLSGLHTGQLNYDRRNRDLALETDTQSAIAKLRAMSVLVEATPHDQVLTMEASYSPDAETDVSLSTTFYRELLYNIEHAIHHMAIIRIGLEAEFSHLTLPPNFGVAYSTVQYQNRKG